jgi:hypothetical protein
MTSLISGQLLYSLSLNLQVTFFPDAFSDHCNSTAVYVDGQFAASDLDLAQRLKLPLIYFIFRLVSALMLNPLP